MRTYNLNIDGVSFTIERNDDIWGDGEHYSTAFMMDAISRYGVKDRTVLDIGTGTGILSILCGKLGASRILAIDIISFVLDCASKNFKTNDVEVEMKRNYLTNGIEEKFDVVLANLPREVGAENLLHAMECVKDDGVLITTWWNKMNFNKYANQFEVIEHVPGEDYDGHVLKKVNIDKT